MRVLGVLSVIAFNENDARAFLFGFTNLCSGFDAEGLGFVAGGDADRGVGEGGDDGEGFAAVFRMELLLYRREEAVEVDVEKGEAVGMGSSRHLDDLERLYSPFICFQLCCR